MEEQMRAQNDQPTRSEVADEQFNVADEVKQASGEMSVPPSIRT